MNKRVFIVTISLLLISSFASGETITLKSGKKIEGEIIEKTKEYIKVDIGVIPVTYYFDEIENIDKKATASDPYKENVNKIGQLSVTSSDRQTFSNEKWGYSLEYPSSWEKMSKEERNQGFAIGFKTKNGDASSYPYVTIQVQRGELLDSDISGKSNVLDLADSLLQPPSGLTREFIKPVTLNYESGCLIRFVKKTLITLINLKGINGAVSIPVTYTHDNYFFSPVFSSQKKDKRYFNVELAYKEYGKASVLVNNIEDEDSLRDFNVAYEKENKDTEILSQEGREIVNYFRIIK